VEVVLAALVGLVLGYGRGVVVGRRRERKEQERRIIQTRIDQFALPGSFRTDPPPPPAP
jgi:hypothetical protein